jgi:CHAT domain-containing protein/Tfp pilus assembly protein PilF
MGRALIKHVLLTHPQPHHSPQWLTLLLALVLAAVTVAAFASEINSTTIQPRDVRTSFQEGRVLAPGDIVQRHVDAGVTHTYELTLPAQQFSRIIVNQKGLDVVLEVYLPDQKLYRRIDSPNGVYGPEIVSLVAKFATTYLVKIHAGGKLLAGDYELRVEALRQASESEEMRVTAERLFSEAQGLRSGARGVDQNLESAIKKYNEALALWKQLGDHLGQGYCLTNTARAYRSRSLIELQPDQLREDYILKALDHFREALAELQQAGDIAGQAFVLNETGFTHRDFGNPSDALTSYERAIQLRLELGDRQGEAQLYNNLGLTYSYIGYQPKALEYYAKALPIWQELGLVDQEMNTLVNAAKANAEMGDADTALTQFQKVLSYCDQELNKENSPLTDSANRFKPFALNGLGLVYDTWANVDSARSNYKQAVQLFHASGNGGDEASVLDNLGMLHASLGDASQALEYFQEALVIRKRLNQPKGLGVTLSNIGYAYTLLGKNSDALQHLALALPYCERARDMRFMAYTLVRMGMVQIASNHPNEALESYRKAFAIQQDPEFVDRRGQAITLDKMAEALALSGEPAQALEKYQAALARWGGAVHDGQGQAISLYGIAKIELERHHLTEARDRIEEAIRIVENLRHRVTSRQLQMIYFAGKQDLYALGIDVRTQLFKLTKSPADKEAALSLSEQARARNLLDSLSESLTEVPNGLSPEYVEKKIRLQQQISTLTQALFRFRSIDAKDQIAIVEQTLATRIKEQDDLQPSSESSASSRQTKLTPLLTPREIQQLLDDNTMVLEYSLGEKRSHLWSVTRAGIEHYFLAGGDEIEDVAKQLGQSLTSYELKKRPGESDENYLERLRQPPDQYSASALKLSRMLLGKVASLLGDKRLVIIADGALQYIPFEILPPPFSPRQSSSLGAKLPPALLSKNEIVYQPSASTLAAIRNIRRPTPSKTVAVFADPVFQTGNPREQPGPSLPGVQSSPLTSREKLKSSLRDGGDDDFSLPRLIYSRKEADAIIAVAPPGSSMEAVGFQANRASVTSPALKQFGIVHFATHGIVNDKHPELSGIVLSLVNERGQQEEGFLTLHDIYGLDLPIHLVVLSACRTGIGRPVRGEGIIALTRGFMYAGAQSVVVSLWRVDDEATAELMKRFYGYMLGPKQLAPTAALRQAKLEMRTHEQKRWRAPFYWAGFVLQGDWK